MIHKFSFDITFIIEHNVSQFVHQVITEDEREDLFEEKLLLLHLLNLKEISPEDLNNFEHITFKNPLVEDGDTSVKLKH